MILNCNIYLIRFKKIRSIVNRNMKKVVYTVIGCISLGIGTVGTILPIIPTVPFLLLSAYCFGRSSKRFNDWFIQTKLYKNNLESYIRGKGMTRKAKIRIMFMVTILMSIGFVMMDEVLVGRIVLASVWLFHVLYFMFGVKTINKNV